jgi:hypothetical protein
LATTLRRNETVYSSWCEVLKRSKVLYSSVTLASCRLSSAGFYICLCSFWDYVRLICLLRDLWYILIEQSCSQWYLVIVLDPRTPCNIAWTPNNKLILWFIELFTFRIKALRLKLNLAIACKFKPILK